VPNENDLPVCEEEIDQGAGIDPYRSLNLKEILVLPSIDPGQRHAIGVDQPEPRRGARRFATDGVLRSVGRTVKTKWFWCAIASSLCWTAWAFTAKLGSREIPPTTMEFISAFGFILVGLGVMGARKIKPEKSSSGKLLALISGLLLAFGGICLFSAYRTGYNASIITSITSLYPVVTVLLALIFLRERLNRVQVVGFFFAAVAILLLSL
jgi:uncharacterized membrane protein